MSWIISLLDTFSPLGVFLVVNVAYAVLAAGVIAGCLIGYRHWKDKHDAR
jgi:hypothetical protein